MIDKNLFQKEKFYNQLPKSVFFKVKPRSLLVLCEIGKRMLGETDINKLLTFAMDIAIELSEAERGMIILFTDSGDIWFETARNLVKKDIEHPEFEISRTIIETVNSRAEGVFIKNALKDPQFQKSKSVLDLKLLSVICFPLIHQEKVFGVVYMDNRSVGNAYKEETYDFIAAFGEFISLAAFHSLEKKKLSDQVQSLKIKVHGKYVFESIITQDPTMIKILQEVSQIADTDATVLIQGESGTGKELIAKALHFNSVRKENPFIPINCAAIPETLLESELFGYVKGAFTGAVSDKKGKFVKADGGTIFLDESSEMSSGLQAKLLRILQSGEYSPLGSSDIFHCDLRIISATNKNLKRLVEENIFRDDLFYRLNIIDILLPPLRDRATDISILIQHFLKILSKKYGKTELKITKEAEKLLLEYNYPGNVRELENIIHRAVVYCKDNLLRPIHLPKNTFKKYDLNKKLINKKDFKSEKQKVIEAFEREYLRECLKDTKGNISKSAQIAGIQYVSFYNKIKKYGIEPYKFK